MFAARRNASGGHQQLPLLFVHSPLVGPSTMRRLADMAVAGGNIVALPDLTSAAQAKSRQWERFVELAIEGAEKVDSEIVVVGHSGAGAFLPKIGEELGDRLDALVFMDAVVPPEQGFHRTPGEMIDELHVEDDDGLLLPWLQWWPDAAIEQLLPNRADRRLLAADMPRLPRSFYDEEIPVPAEWSEWPCAYLKLSSAYDAEYETAAERGWPRISLDCSHLSTHTEPDMVLEGIRHLSHAV